MKSEARRKIIRYDRVMTEAEQQQLSAEVANKLQACYPGHIWLVTVLQGGILQVVNPLLSRSMGFVIHLTKIDPELKIVMRAGGELLERYRQRRGWIHTSAIAEAKRDSRGDMIINDK